VRQEELPEDIALKFEGIKMNILPTPLSLDEEQKVKKMPENEEKPSTLESYDMVLTNGIL